MLRSILISLILAWSILSTTIPTPHNASLTPPSSSPVPGLLSTPSSPLNTISNLSGINPPPDFGINLVFDSAKVLSPVGVYNIALDTVYRLSLHPWSGTISRAVFFSLPQYTEQVLFEPKQLSRGAVRELQTGFAILALYAGVVAMTPPTRNLFYELQVTISRDHVAVGRCTIHSTPPTPPTTLPEIQTSDRNRTVTLQPQFNSSSDSGVNTTANPLTTNTGTYTDPEDPTFRLTYTFKNARLNSKDVFLAAIDGIAAAARNNPGKRCPQLGAASPGASSRRGVVVSISALRHPRRVLFTYQYASRAMVLLTRVMQEGNRWEAVGFYVEHGGAKFGEGFVRGTVAGDVAVV